MKTVKTIKSKIINATETTLQPTVDIYSDCVLYFVNIINLEYDFLKDLKAKESLTATEKLTHHTSKNTNPKYNDFDEKFYKFPSYLRRAAINEARGLVSSYRSNYANWELEKAIYEDKYPNKKFRKSSPKLPKEIKTYPAMYKKEQFSDWSDDKKSCCLKIYRNNDWVWYDINLNIKNFKNRNIENCKLLSPVLIKRGKKFYLDFPYENNVEFKKIDIKDRIIVSVDLGLTNTAVCSAMNSNGTVLDRLFVKQSREKDQLRIYTSRMSKATRESGIYNKKPNLWRKINNLQTHIVQSCASEIIKFAIKNNARIIVFEHLSKFKTPRGFYGAKKLRFKLQYWAKCKIINTVKNIANQYGISISRINPRNTSALAFDGSGFVIRNHKKDIATFTNGKVYNADLNASYNIGARYFLRAILNPMAEKHRLEVQAKVPELVSRTNCSLASLISLQQALRAS